MNLAATWNFCHSVQWLSKNVHSSHQTLANYYLKNTSQGRIWLYYTASSLGGIFPSVKVHIMKLMEFYTSKNVLLLLECSQLSGGKNSHFKGVSEKNWKQSTTTSCFVLVWIKLG